MRVPSRTQLAHLRGTARLAFDATAGVAEIVERMHRTVQLRRWPLGKPVSDRTRGITGLVYRCVHGSIRLIGQGVDGLLTHSEAFLPEGEPGAEHDAILSAVNGVCGDYLHRSGSPLAIDMSLRHRGQLVDPRNPAATVAGVRPLTGKLLILVHGLCLNDAHWQRHKHDHGAALAEKFGYTPLYLRYNSGLHIGDNGRALGDMLEVLLGNWPVPVRELTILGHSMGGLLARGACHHGQRTGHAWLRHLRRLVFLGTPHHGAPLERGGSWIDIALDASPYSAPFSCISKTRSAGINDLGEGRIRRDSAEPVPLPEGVECYVIAATLGDRRGVVSDYLIGDGMVPLRSALGQHMDGSRTLAVPNTHRWTGYGMGHLDLLDRPEVFTRMCEWLGDRPSACS